MPTIEERVAYLEGRMSDHAQMVLEIRDAVRHLEERFDSRFEGQDSRFLAIDRRLEGLEDDIGGNGRCAAGAAMMR